MIAETFILTEILYPNRVENFRCIGISVIIVGGMLGNSPLRPLRSQASLEAVG